MSAPQSTPIYRKNTMSAGLLTDRPDTPQIGDEYLSTDTKQYFICYEVGVWVLNSPTYAESPDVEMIPIPASNTFTPASDYCYFETTVYVNGFGILVSTASPSETVTAENVIAAGHRLPTNAAQTTLKKFDNGLIKKGTVLYIYRYTVNCATLDALLASTIPTVSLTGTSNGFGIKKAYSLKTAAVTIG